MEQRTHHQDLKLVADSRLLKVLSPDIFEWLSTTIHPHYLKHGITKKAFVEPEDYFGKISLQMYINQSNKEGDVQMQIFKDLDEAKEWLQKAPNPKGE